MMNNPQQFHIEALIQQPVSICWEAFTQSNTWLGLRNIDLDRGDYLVSSALPYLSGRHQILSSIDKKQLDLLWYIEGYPGELSVKFESSENATLIKINYKSDVTDAPDHLEPLKYPEHYFYFISQSWEHALKNLKCSLEDNEAGVAIPRENNDHVINLSIEINTTPEKLYEALISAEQMKLWGGKEFMMDAECDPVVGGTYSYGWYAKGTPLQEVEDGPQKILELEPNKLLVHDWYGGQEVSKVSWQIKPAANDKVKLIFKHSPILGHSTGNVWSYRSGWADTLYSLKWFLERGMI